MEPVFNMDQAIEESNRCLLCYDAPCSKNCPAGTDPGTFIRKFRFRNFNGAWKTIKNNNILGGICGALCPVENLCEKECTAGKTGHPVRIGKLQRFIVEYGWKEGYKLNNNSPLNNKKIAIIGSGPSGLSCAAELLKAGYKVDIFEKKKKTGGMLRYIIPDYKLNNKYLDRELKDLHGPGLKIKCGHFLKTEKDIEKLFSDGYDAVYIASGTWGQKGVGIASNYKGCYKSIDILEKIKTSKKSSINKLFKNREVAVIGGGDVAINSAETAKRYGAKNVYIIYRRSFKQMPGSAVEKLKTLKSGIHFLMLTEPVKYITKNKKITGIRLKRNILGKPDRSGRPLPVNIKGSEHTIKMDIIIDATGLEPDKGNTSLFSGIKLSDKKLIIVNKKTGRTSKKNIYAGGDIVRGPSLIIEAVSDGRRAAESIIRSFSKPGVKIPAQNGSYKNMGIDFCGIKFINPILLSSSPATNSASIIEKAFEKGCAGIVFKTLGTGKTEIIHPSPRMSNYNYHNSNLIGLLNVEQISDRPLKDNLADIRYLKKKWSDRIIIASILGLSKDEWKELAIASEDAGADMLELNFSCPNMTVEGAGLKVGQAFKLVEEYTHIVKKTVKIPVMAKLTPNITDINEPAIYAKKGGADAIAAINTVRGLTEIDINDFVPKPNIFGIGAPGGFSGPAIKPIGLRFISELAQNKKLGLPLSGIGGIETYIDALEYILCGSSTIQIATGILHYGDYIIEDILEGLTYYMKKREVNSLKELVGAALPNIKTSSEFNLKRQGKAVYDINRCIGCGLCYTVCNDAGGQCIEWDNKRREPIINEKKCLSCMICSFVCPVSAPALITYKEVRNKKPVIAERVF